MDASLVVAVPRSDELREAMEACGCPRSGDETLTAPLCPIESFLHTGGDTIAFVRRPSTTLQCGFLRNFGMGYYCTSEPRGRIFEEFCV